MFDLIEPSHSGRSRVLAVGGEQRLASIGSPSVVPVPCASTASTSGGLEAGVGERLADHPLLGGAVGGGQAVGGAVLVDGRAPDHGEHRVAVALRVGEPLEQQRRRRPRDQPVPSAASAKDLQRPSGARPRWRLNSTKIAGLPITVTPPASASVHSPPRSAWAARCIATSEEEQAVSTVTAGPSRPRV